MSNFIIAIVTIVYALVCLPKEADQEKCSTSKSAEDCYKEGAEGELGDRALNGQKTSHESKTNNE
jgi:hypothetical protein